MTMDLFRTAIAGLSREQIEALSALVYPEWMRRVKAIKQAMPETFPIFSALTRKG